MRWLSALCPVCQHHACSVESHQATPAVTAEPTVAIEPVRCACGRPATVVVNLRLWKQPLFGAPSDVPVCQSCYPETVTRGQLLRQTAIVGAA